MRIAALEAFGIDGKVIDLWQADGHEELLPVQEHALQKCRVMDGRNVLVFSPTSSGKTFVGEMAAIRTARQNKRAVYLVPQKALAEEKFNEFRSRYGPLGVRVVISTRDRREFDRDINRGQFHIAVIVFEKMQGLLVTSPGLLRNVGLVVIDELQMIGDKARGADLELLLTKIKLSEGRPQIIGLSAVLGNSERLAKWMDAELCHTNLRPVELRKGVLWNGAFHYSEHNSGKDGVEELAPPPDEGDRIGILVSQVRAFVGAGEQSIVFCKSRQESVDTATAIAKGLRGKRAEKALDELQYLEDSLGKDRLARLLERGVAYHNSDLDWDQRDVIERWFRRGDIAVLCSTTTLAMGINMPAKNVFLDPEKWDHDRSGRWSPVPISQAEYENISGRAGRLGLEGEFGRAMIVADSEFQAGTYRTNYVKGSLGTIKPALGNDPLSYHVLNLVASQMCQTEEEIKETLLGSFTGELYWRGGSNEVQFGEKLSKGMKHCIEGGLIGSEDGRLIASELGRLAAVKGLSVDTAIQLAQFAKEVRECADDVHPLEVLSCLSGTEDGADVYFYLATQEHRTGEYLKMLKTAVAALPDGPRGRLAEINRLSTLSYEGSKRAKKTLLLYDWIQGLPTREIEGRFHCFSGSIVGLAGEFSWLVEAFSAVARIVGWPETAVSRMGALSEQLRHGVVHPGVQMANVGVRGLGRGRIMGLLASGLDTLEKVAEAPRQQIEKLVTRPIAARLFRKLASLFQREEATKGDEDGGTQTAPADAAEQPGCEPEWAEEYPPSDDMGVAYQSDVDIHIDGRADKRRHLVRIDGKEAWLTEQSFSAALKLAVAAKTTEVGWASAGQLGEPDGYHQVIRRLKQDLKAADVDADKLVENNRAKQYRFSVPPRNITVDADMVIRRLPEHKKLMDELKAHMGEQA